MKLVSPTPTSGSPITPHATRSTSAITTRPARNVSFFPFGETAAHKLVRWPPRRLHRRSTRPAWTVSLFRHLPLDNRLSLLPAPRFDACWIQGRRILKTALFVLIAAAAGNTATSSEAAKLTSQAEQLYLQ